MIDASMTEINRLQHVQLRHALTGILKSSYVLLLPRTAFISIFDSTAFIKPINMKFDVKPVLTVGGTSAQDVSAACNVRFNHNDNEINVRAAFIMYL